jgi:hypothetical protein
VTASQGLRALFLVNAVGCLLAAVVLVALPSAIPAAIGIAVAPDQYMVLRLLGAAELAIATVCIAAVLRPIRDTSVVCVAMLVVFHSGSILAGAMELASHGNIVVVANLTVRTAIVLALMWLAGRPSLRR